VKKVDLKLIKGEGGGAGSGIPFRDRIVAAAVFISGATVSLATVPGIDDGLKDAYTRLLDVYVDVLQDGMSGRLSEAETIDYFDPRYSTAPERSLFGKRVVEGIHSILFFGHTPNPDEPDGGA